MSNFNPENGGMEMWMICTAVGNNRNLIKQMKKNSDGTYPVNFEVGGVKLDFSKVANGIKEHLNELVEQEASSMLSTKYDALIGELNDIQERIEDQKSKLFKYEWEEKFK